MKTFVVFAALLSLATAFAAGDVVRLSEPVAETDSYEDFGAKIDDSVEALSLSAVVGNAETYSDRTVVIKTRVSKVCQKKGCFFIAQDGGSVVRVAFKDYGFFVPTDISGKTVTLSGKLVKRELSAEEAEHYSEDAPGADLPAGTVYEIIADAVRVPKTAADG
ncbi:MAG: DUF4920 domain-containing protein [Woeseiaceae bacterium]|nr:DUF4920 domain-containing protein [Woeseiaceae bacterium]